MGYENKYVAVDKPAIVISTWLRYPSETNVDEARVQVLLELLDGRIVKSSAVVNGEQSVTEYQRATANAIRAALDDLKL